MRAYRKMDKTQIAQTNKYNVLHCLIRGKPINRAAIAKLTDLSIPTVMSIIDDLLGKKIVRSLGRGESSGGEYGTANGACRVLANDLWRRRALPI